MIVGLTSGEALLATSCLHAGFQAVVSVVVYPALASTPAASWAGAHEAHSRRISYVVGPVYAVVAAACLWTLLDHPSALALVAVAGNAVAGLTTALVAAPTHGRLGASGPTAPLLRRLLVADRVRAAGALVAAVAALAGVRAG